MPTHIKPAPTFGLRDIKIQLARGTVTGIVGESGSGQTTIGRIIAGLNSAQAGTVAIDGIEFDVSKSGRRGRLLGRVQMIFQDPSVSLNPRMSVDETLGESIRFGARIGPRGALPDLSTIMDRLGLARSLLNRNPNQLSGGQKRAFVSPGPCWLDLRSLLRMSRHQRSTCPFRPKSSRF